MNGETDSGKEKDMNKQADTEALAPEILDRIKHPPAIDDAMRELSPEELMANPAIAPQMLQEPSDLRDDRKRD